MYRAIVVGTDGSETATNAVRRAGELAKAFGATLHVVSGYWPLPASARLAVADPQAMAFAGADAVRRAEEDHTREVTEMLAEAVRQAGVPDAKTHAVPGDAAEAILEVAEREGADLVVVGNRGMSGARRFLLGSVPNKVSHHAGCSVLIVHTTGSA